MCESDCYPCIKESDNYYNLAEKLCKNINNPPHIEHIHKLADYLQKLAEEDATRK